MHYSPVYDRKEKKNSFLYCLRISIQLTMEQDTQMRSWFQNTILYSAWFIEYKLPERVSNIKKSVYTEDLLNTHRLHYNWYQNNAGQFNFCASNSWYCQVKLSDDSKISLWWTVHAVILGSRYSFRISPVVKHYRSLSTLTKKYYSKL